MNRLLPFLILPLLAACDQAAMTQFQTAIGVEPPPPEEPAPIPPEVAPYLPPGVPGTIVMQDANGCYVFSVEVTDPPSGFPVRDAAGNPICAAPAA